MIQNVSNSLSMFYHILMESSLVCVEQNIGGINYKLDRV